jgi:hypothetical protein
LDGRAPTSLAALDVQVAADRRGRGVAALALTALRSCAREHGLNRLVVPVRPTGKAEHPDEPMEQYLARRRADDLSADPWLRVHERLGARFVKIAPFAMTITGTLQQKLDRHRPRRGATVVKGGLSPVLASPEQGIGIYVEPNVWFEHPVEEQ